MQQPQQPGKIELKVVIFPAKGDTEDLLASKIISTLEDPDRNILIVPFQKTPADLSAAASPVEESAGYITVAYGPNVLKAFADASNGDYSPEDTPAYQKLTEELHGYKEWAEDYKRLVREIDVIINGEEGAAKQASLCDLGGQIKELADFKNKAEAKRPPVDSQMFLGNRMRSDIRKDMDDHSARWKALGWPPMSWEEGAEWMYWRAVMRVNKEPDLLEVDDQNLCSPVDAEDGLKPEDMPQTENPQASYWFEKACQNLVERNDFKAQLNSANDKIKALTESKPSPVIEIGERLPSYTEFKERVQFQIKILPNEADASDYAKGKVSAFETIVQWIEEISGSHPAPALIVGEREEELQGYKEWAEDNKRLVREIDVIINGEEGAAKQASLCDLGGQIKELVNFKRLAELLNDNSLKQVSDINVADLLAPTRQPLPEEIMKWIREFESQFEIGSPEQFGCRKGLVGMYRRMQEEIAGWKETASLINREGSLIQDALASARTLILNIKTGNIYQEPADECDKWLNSNPETK